MARKPLRHRLAESSRTRRTQRRALAVSLPVALFLLSLAAAAHAQQPPPVTTTWLSRISAEGADTVRPHLGIQAEVSGIAGSIAPDIPIPAGGGCAYCAANMFLALEQGGNRVPLRPGIEFALPYMSATELQRITGNDALVIYMQRQEDQLAFLRESLGAGDHAILGIRIQRIQLLGEGEIGLHAVNIANVDGELLVFDGGAAANGIAGAEGVPLGDFFANGMPGAYRVLAEDNPNRNVQVLLRTGRDYSLPVDHNIFFGWLHEEKPLQWKFPSPVGATRVRVSSDELRETLEKMRRRHCGTLV